MKKLSAFVLIGYEVINSLVQMTVDSIANTLFPILDKIVFLTTESFGYSSSGELTGNIDKVGEFILTLANSFVVAIVLWYLFRQIFAYFFSFEVETPWKFIMRLVFFSILMNAAYFVTYQLIDIVEQVTEFLSVAIGDKIDKVSFDEFANIVNDTVNIEDEESFNIFSVEGLINTFVYFGIFYLGITYAVRYVILRLMAIVSPIAIMNLVSKSTSNIFRNWFIMFMGYLISQVLIVLVLAIPHLLDLSEGLESKLLLCGILFTLYKVNDLTHSLITGQGFSNDIQSFGIMHKTSKTE